MSGDVAPTLTDEVRAYFRALGRKGGNTTAMYHDMDAVAAHARQFAPSNIEYFFDEVDKDRTLDKSDRERRARAAQRRYFGDMARRRKAKQNGGGP